MQETVVIGLTGQTGAGKSTVGELLKRRGVAWVDADEIAHDVADNEKSCLADMALEFTIDILNVDGTLNRKRLAEIVFHDKARLRRLNDIIFPYIISAIEAAIQELRDRGVDYVVLDAPTLFESGANRFCDVIVSVVASETTRIQRIIARDELTQAEAQARIAAQHDESYYVRRSDYVIENDGPLDDLRLNTADVLGKIMSGEYLNRTPGEQAVIETVPAEEPESAAAAQEQAE